MTPFEVITIAVSSSVATAIGCSIATQADADQNMPELLKCRDLVPVLGVSAEPLLGPIDLSPWLEFLDWVIVGGESGPNARPMHPDWARSMRDQCVNAGVPFFFKQWGEWIDEGELTDTEGLPWEKVYSQTDGCFTLMYRWGKKYTGRLLDGREWNEFPKVSQERGV